MVVTLDTVRSLPGFVAFSRILGLKIKNGESSAALRMLRAIGAPGKIANEIIEGWELERLELPQLSSMASVGISKPLLQACRLAHFVDDIGAYDWNVVLRKAGDELEQG